MNVSRLVASVGGYFYSTAPGALAVHLYGGNTASATVAGTGVQVRQHADYPWSGKVRIDIDPEAPAHFALKLRIPGWARSFAVRLNGEPHPVPSTNRGYADLSEPGRAAIPSSSSCRCRWSAFTPTLTSGATSDAWP